MVKFCIGLLWLLQSGTAGIAQSWSQSALVPLSTTNAQEGERQVRVALHGYHLAIGDPQWQGRGLVLVHGRDAGGPDTWEVVHALEGDGAEGSAFGQSVAFSDQGLFVAGDHGLWHYVLGNELVEETYFVDASEVWDIAMANGTLIGCGPLVPGFPTSVIKRFDLSTTSGTYEMTTGLAIQPQSASVSSCTGRVIAYEQPHLIVADPCWRTTTAIPVSGLIKSFLVDAEADTIIGDADPSGFGGYWPFGQGLNLGMDFGRALKLKGDTLFVGFGPAMSGMPAHLEVFRKNDEAGWDRFKQIHVPEDWTGTEIGDLGTAIMTAGSDLIIGTDNGLAFYQEVDTSWVFQHFEPLGGPVSSISRDGDRMAVAVPLMGQVHIYERVATGIADPPLSDPVLRIAPNPALEQAVVFPLRSTCGVQQLWLTDAYGRAMEHLLWDGTKPLTIPGGPGRSGLSFVRAVDDLGRTCATGRILWVDPH